MPKSHRSRDAGSARRCGSGGQTQPGRLVRRPEHGPHGDRDQGGGHEGPEDESFSHQASPSVQAARPRAASAILHCKERRFYEAVHRAKTADAVANQCAANALNRHVPRKRSRRQARHGRQAWRSSRPAQTSAAPARGRARCGCRGKAPHRPNRSGGAADQTKIVPCRRPRGRPRAGNGGIALPLARGVREGKGRLARVLDLLEHRLVADHQRHHGRHHRQPPRRRIRRSAGGPTIDVSFSYLAEPVRITSCCRA